MELPFAAPAAGQEDTVDVEAELHDIKGALERLENYISETKESAEAKAQRELIARILEALS